MVIRYKKKYTLKQFYAKAFTRGRAGGSLVRGISYEEAGGLGTLGTSVVASSGKQEKEPRLFIIPLFESESSGFFSFSGFKLEILGGYLCKE